MTGIYDIMMRVSYKVTMLVVLQISLIITSSQILIHFESQTNLTGNLVNISGKNRILTGFVQIELNHSLFHHDMHIESIYATLDNLEQNIHHLKYGGLINGIETLPLSSQFEDNWDSISKTFEQYNKMAIALISQKDIALADIETTEEIAIHLIFLSDELTENLGHDVEKLSVQVILLQIILGFINVASHIFLIVIILRILNKNKAEQIKKEKFEAIGELAAMIAHDMRNPLGTIKNSIILIQSNGGDDLVNKETNRINRAIKRLSHQIDGVLNYVRDTPLVLEPHHINEILKQSLDVVSIPSTIKLNMPVNDIVVYCDAQKLEFVFANLLLNAIQSINDNAGYITITLQKRKDKIVISFENSGPNILEKNLSQIFEPLFTTKMEGTGLGLTSCKNIIQKHHGTITANNNPVTFTIHMLRYGG